MFNHRCQPSMPTIDVRQRIKGLTWNNCRFVYHIFQSLYDPNQHVCLHFVQYISCFENNSEFKPRPYDNQFVKCVQCLSSFWLFPLFGLTGIVPIYPMKTRIVIVFHPIFGATPRNSPRDATSSINVPIIWRRATTRSFKSPFSLKASVRVRRTVNHGSGFSHELLTQFQAWERQKSPRLNPGSYYYFHPSIKIAKNSSLELCTIRYTPTSPNT